MRPSEPPQWSLQGWGAGGGPGDESVRAGKELFGGPTGERGTGGQSVRDAQPYSSLPSSSRSPHRFEGRLCAQQGGQWAEDTLPGKSWSRGSARKWPLHLHRCPQGDHPSESSLEAGLCPRAGRHLSRSFPWTFLLCVRDPLHGEETAWPASPLAAPEPSLTRACAHAAFQLAFPECHPLVQKRNL